MISEVNLSEPRNSGVGRLLRSPKRSVLICHFGDDVTPCITRGCWTSVSGGTSDATAVELDQLLPLRRHSSARVVSRRPDRSRWRANVAAGGDGCGRRRRSMRRLLCVTIIQHRGCHAFSLGRGPGYMRRRCRPILTGLADLNRGAALQLGWCCGFRCGGTGVRCR